MLNGQMNHEWRETPRKGIPEYYSEGDKDKAYYWLGHTAHLLADMTVPAHAHGDPHGPDDMWPWSDTEMQWWNPSDDYEGYVGSGGRMYNWAFSPDANWGVIPLPREYDQAGQITDNIRDPFLELFRSTVEQADDYDSDDANGQVDQGFRRDGRSIPDPEAAEIANAMMPLAMQQTAKLIRYFYSLVDGEEPVLRIVGQNSHDPSDPQVTGATELMLRIEASDDGETFGQDPKPRGDSGIGKNCSRSSTLRSHPEEPGAKIGSTPINTSWIGLPRPDYGSMESILGREIPIQSNSASFTAVVSRHYSKARRATLTDFRSPPRTEPETRPRLRSSSGR